MREPHTLLVFEKARALAVLVHAICSDISKRRYPALPDQLMRASNSVPANIAEGCAHSSRREFARFLQLALASCGEAAYHIAFARDTKAITTEHFEQLNGANREVRRMLASLLRVVRDELTEDDDNPSVVAMQARRNRSPRTYAKKPRD